MKAFRSTYVQRLFLNLATAGASLALPSTSTALAQPRTPAQWKAFLFDDGFTASRGLGFEFSRPVITVSPDGTPAAPDKARFANLVSMASAPSVQPIRQTTGYTVLLASGLDHDGVTPLLVTYEDRSSIRYLDVFAGPADSILAAEQTGNGRTRTIVDATGDLMRGAIPGKRYTLTCGVVCHGLIVLFSTVTAFDAGSQSWLASANAFIVSQDRGRTWDRVYESAPFSPGSPRGNTWSMQNWWPMERGPAPRDAFFAATEYCHNPGSPGGRFYLMRARRDSPTGLWTLEPGAVAMQVSGGVRQHVHPGGVIPFGDSGIRAFFPVGDGRQNSRVVSLINTDGSYAGGEWQVNETYHGAAGVPGLDANLFMGCAPGPLANTVLVGGDLSSEQLMLLTMDEHEPHPRTDRIYGQSCADGNGFTAFMIRTPTPELGGPYVANAEPWEPSVLPYSRRALYSRDGLQWVQALAPDGGGEYPILHDGHIYFGVANSHGFAMTPAPEIATARPLLIGPGGLQHASAYPVLAPGSMPRIVPLQRDALGRWIDNGVPLDPQPPTLGNVYRVTTSANDPSVWIGRILPFGLVNRGSNALTNDLQLRVWAHHQDPSRSATLAIGVGDGASNPLTYRSWIIASTNGWIPVITQPLRPPADGTLRLSIRALGDSCTDQTMYLALDNVQEGAGMPGYSMPPDISNPPTGTACPDEHASITGLRCQKAWTVTLALQIPEDGFDYRTPSQTVWPLACVWGDDRNFLEFNADTVRGQIWATLTIDGVPWSTIVGNATVLERGAPILLSIAQPLSNSAGIEITSSVGGREVSTAAIPNRLTIPSRLAHPPREIRFWSQTAPPSWAGAGAATSPLLVWGGRIDESRALSRPERKFLLETLEFLNQLPPW